jgi:3'(2'), 5'-bisphosphate nucleotidase
VYPQPNDLPIQALGAAGRREPVTERSEAQDRRIAEILSGIAVEAAGAIQEFDCRSVTSRQKPDRSLVTAADEAAEGVILRGLARKLPGVAVVSEESRREQQAPSGEFLLVDPLDGTVEFLSGRDEYTVNIALVRDGIPAVGVVAAPALGLLWRGSAGRAERLRFSPDGREHDCNPIRTRRWPKSPVAAVSRSHLDAATTAFLAGLGDIETAAYGSALKFCRIAEGAADLYPRLAPTSEWDVAAGHALVAAAGGAVMAAAGGPLAYGRAAESFRVPGFLAWGDPTAVQRVIR